MSGPEDFRAITTVYSYYLPEVRDVVSRLVRRYPHEVFLRSIHPGLDDFHEPVLARLVEAHRIDVPALGGLAHRYPTAGSEEGIREYMSWLALRGERRIYMLEGDYEGYREVARSRGLETIEVPAAADPARLPPGPWFLSNPSARDGDLLPDDTVRTIAAAGHRIFYDLSYLGATDPRVCFDLALPNLAAAALSFSKPYGLFYYRIGFLFTREPLPSLHANRWFKSVFALLVADRVLAELDLAAVAARYKALQRSIVADLAREHDGLPIVPSDAFLLARMPAAGAARLDARWHERLQRHRRPGDHYRFCLTPYFLERAG